MTPLARIIATFLAVVSVFSIVIIKDKKDENLRQQGVKSNTHAADKKSVLALRNVKQQLPMTDIQSIKCNEPMDLCAIRAGENIYYTDRSAGYLFIGHIYDLNKKVNLTEMSLRKALPSVENNDGVPVERIGLGNPRAAQLQQASTSLQAMDSPKLDIPSLPYEGAIIWGKSNGVPVYVFSDFACHYCKALTRELKDLNVKVYEFPISILGSRAISESVFCAKDKVAALHKAYAGQPLTTASCDTRALDLNERFAAQNSLDATPIIVRRDGQILRGGRPRAELISWINGGNIK
jgi:thiol:disulfide interchange protein DsbC